MTYTDYLSAAEMNRWLIDVDIAWDNIDERIALSQADVLQRVRDSALIESFFPIFTPRALDLLWDWPTATAIFSVQLYESYKHFQVFNQYLEAVDFKPITDDEIVAVRQAQVGLRFTNRARLLTRYMMSEHFAAYNFFKDHRIAAEPVLAQILHLVAKDEVRHCQFAYELLRDLLQSEPELKGDVLDEARQFKHLGELVLPAVPVAHKNDFAAIVAVNRKVQRLTGQSLGRSRAQLTEVTF